MLHHPFSVFVRLVSDAIIKKANTLLEAQSSFQHVKGSISSSLAGSTGKLHHEANSLRIFYARARYIFCKPNKKAFPGQVSQFNCFKTAHFLKNFSSKEVLRASVSAER